jgi:hypothetical protein
MLRNEPLFDLVSYARRGADRRDHLSLGQIAHIARTVRRAPEVMVKVLPNGANSLAAVRKHLNYIGRNGEFDLETDNGEQLKTKDDRKDLLQDWDLDLEEHRRQSDLAATRGRRAPRLVHKVIFSMPAGTAPEKVLAAVKHFCREEFALKHRYVMALHTDEPHPHVHVVIKAMSEQGQRLQIRKATLREWRRGFATHLRDQGVEANATERAVRGNSHGHMLDGIYRPMHDKKKGRYSTHMRKREEEVGRELLAGGVNVEPGKSRLVATRKEVERGWRAVSDILLNEGQPELAARVRRFVDEMPPPRTDKEVLAHALAARVREGRERGVAQTR